jgi:hypothetical protein
MGQANQPDISGLAIEQHDHLRVQLRDQDYARIWLDSV